MVAKKTPTVTPKDVYDIVNEEVIASGLIPNLDSMHLKFLGKNWFKDGVTGIAYHFVRTDGKLAVKETRQSVADVKNRLKATPKEKVVKPTTFEIKCVDCGAMREVAVQDVFQVKRCITCQRKYRNHKRAERIKAKKVANV